MRFPTLRLSMGLLLLRRSCKNGISSRLCSLTLTTVQTMPIKFTQGPTISSCSGSYRSSLIMHIDFCIILKLLLSLNSPFLIGAMKLSAHSVYIFSSHEQIDSVIIGKRSSLALVSCMYLSKLFITYITVSECESTYAYLLAFIALFDQEDASLNVCKVFFGTPLLNLFRCL